MGERKISKIIYIIVAIFFAFVMIKALFQSSNSSLKEISKELIECKGGEFLAENEGKLVLITGVPTYDDSYSIIDNEYNVEVKNAVILNRNAFQYRYYKEKNNDETFKRDSTYADKYYVTSGWVESKCQKSENLYEKNDVYSNPESYLKSETFSGYFNIGEFKLSSDIVNKAMLIENNHYGLIDGENDVLGNYHVIIENGIEYLSNVKDNIIEIGDYRINFTYYNFKDDQAYSFVGKQEGNTIERYESGSINLYDTYEGNYSKEELLNKLKEDYNDARFGILFLFIILLIIGLYVFRDNLENLIDNIKKNKRSK